MKRFCFHSFLRSESEMKMTRDREVKFLENFREISENKISDEFFFLPKSSLKYFLKKLKVDILSHDLKLLTKMQEDVTEVD